VVSLTANSFLRLITDANERQQAALHLHKFALDYFNPTGLRTAAFSFDGNSVTSHWVDQSDLRFHENEACLLEPGSWEKHATYLKFAYGSMANAQVANVAIGRICRAVRQGPSTEGIIDLAIALECLVEARAEIRFQFALFNALISQESLAERHDAFDLLQSLYDLRSVGVHGGRYDSKANKKMSEIRKNWDRILLIARKNVTYYLLFCRDNKHSGWSKHLRELSFGGTRLTLEGIHD